MLTFPILNFDKQFGSHFFQWGGWGGWASRSVSTFSFWGELTHVNSLKVLYGRVYSLGLIPLLDIWVFPKIGVPQIINFNRIFHYKPSILGYPYFLKHPYRCFFQIFWMKESATPENWSRMVPHLMQHMFSNLVWLTLILALHRAGPWPSRETRASLWKCCLPGM